MTCRALRLVFLGLQLFLCKRLKLGPVVICGTRGQNKCFGLSHADGFVLTLVLDAAQQRVIYVGLVKLVKVRFRRQSQFALVNVCALYWGIVLLTFNYSSVLLVFYRGRVLVKVRLNCDSIVNFVVHSIRFV
jgi:hypothetical protein